MSAQSLEEFFANYENKQGSQMSDETEIPTDLDMDMVERQLKILKPEVLQDLAGRVNAHAAANRHEAKQNSPAQALSRMSNGEAREFVRKKLGFDPGF